ncbi:TetR/AcrR family transcriptional regulator [Segnochrobactraceae bacterium EtOH-i3]
MDESSEMKKGERTRRKLKAAALKLFALRGLDNVSVRDILDAAGQKNAGSINYHFSSRDALIRELVVDVARMLDADNNRRLDAVEAEGGPRNIREVTEILLPQLSPEPGEDAGYTLRFFNSVLISHRDILFEATSGEDRGTRRCFAHIRRLAPDMPAEILQQRLMLVLLYGVAAASSMEAAEANQKVWKNLWGYPSARANLADTMAGLITAPISPQTAALVGAPRSGAG